MNEKCNTTEDLDLTPLVQRLIARGDMEAATEILRLRAIVRVTAKTIGGDFPGTARTLIEELEQSTILRGVATS